MQSPPTVSILLLLLITNIYCLNNTNTLRIIHSNRTVSQGPDFPKNASAFNLTIPFGLKLRALGVGLGTQNYTCSKTSGISLWKPLGALAELRDITNYNGNPARVTREVIKHEGKQSISFYKKLAKHYFIPHKPFPLPSFYFFENNSTTTKENFIVVEKIGSMPSPNHPNKNVMWLALKVVEGINNNGDKMIFRTNTHLGVAPDPLNCTKEGQETYQKYSALYWFYH